MKMLALAFLLVAVATQAEDSPLVKAAKASGGPKKKSSRKVITNADVKKSKGKIKELPPSPSTTAAKPAGAGKSSLQLQEEQRRAADIATKRVVAAKAKVGDLEKELSSLEQRYYEANDLNYRDTTIAERFRQTKQQLDGARKELADARDAQQRIASKSP